MFEVTLLQHDTITDYNEDFSYQLKLFLGHFGLRIKDICYA